MTWLEAVVSTDAALLPPLAVQQVWLRMGWGVVLAWLVLAAAPRGGTGALRSGRLRAMVALAMGLWAWVPGPVSPAYWLGLAFQAPSVTAVLLCLGAVAGQLRNSLRAGAPVVHADAMERASLALCALGVVAGWILLLDTLALLPVSLYARGFGPAAVGAVALAALLPAVAWPPRRGVAVWHMALVPAALLALVVLRLPTGNVWDAVLDPWLWLVLQWRPFQVVWSRYKNTSALRTFHKG